MFTLVPTLLASIACTDSATISDSGPLDTEPADYEEGCILVDDGDGYKFLADALTVVDAGGTITLCQGILEEHVTINRSVTIVGPGDSLVWSAPVNEVALEITGAANVTLSGFSLESTRSGIQITDSSDITISDVAFTAIEGTAILANDTEGLLVEDCLFVEPKLGGVQVNGGTAEVTSSTFDYAFGFAVKGLGGATVGLSESTVTGTWYTALNEDSQFVDGYGFWGTEDAVLISTNNVYTDNLAGMWTDGADLDSSGDTALAGLYGAFCILGACKFDQGTFTDNLAYGIIAANQGDGVSITNTIISGDPEVVYNDGDSGLSVGLWVQADGVIEITDVEIYGHNSAGAQVTPWSGDLEVNLTRLTMDNNGRFGLILSDVDAVLIDVNVDNLREVEPGFIDNTITHGYGVLISGGSTVQWNGGGARNSELINVLNNTSTLIADGIEIIGGSLFGLWNISGDLTFDNGLISDAPYQGGISSQYAASISMSGNTWEDNYATRYYYYDASGDETAVTETYYYWESVDFQSYFDGPVTLTDNTFRNGSYGLILWENADDVVLSNNTWTNYNQRVIYIYAYSAGGANRVIIEDSTFEDVGGYAIYCYYGTVVLDDVSFDGLDGYRSAASSYYNGEFNYEYDYTYYGPAVYGYDCEMELDQVNIADSAEHAIQLSASSVILLDVTVTGGSEQGYSGEGAILLDYYTSDPPNVIASGVTVTDNASGAGIMVRGYSGNSAGGTVDLSDVTVSGAAGSGLAFLDIYDTAVTLENINVTGSGEAGLSFNGTDLSLATASFSDNTEAGISLLGSSSYPVTADLSDVTSSGNGATGLAQNYATTVLDAVSLSSNTGYGMVCDSETEVVGCDETDLLDNTEGPHCGCHDSCSELPGPLCEDQPDDETEVKDDPVGDSGLPDTGGP
jgi:hypothetical protein